MQIKDRQVESPREIPEVCSDTIGCHCRLSRTMLSTSSDPSWVTLVSLSGHKAAKKKQCMYMQKP